MAEFEDVIYGPESSYIIECIEITHSLWPKPLRYVTNVADGVTVIQNGQPTFYEYAVIAITRGNVSDDLDQKISISVGDLGKIVPELVDLIVEHDSVERPRVVYRMFSSLDLVNPTQMIEGIEVTQQNTDYQGTTFEAEAEKLNEVGTGLLFTKENFPTLVGFY